MIWKSFVGIANTWNWAIAVLILALKNEWMRNLYRHIYFALFFFSCTYLSVCVIWNIYERTNNRRFNFFSFFSPFLLRTVSLLRATCCSFIAYAFALNTHTERETRIVVCHIECHIRNVRNGAKSSQISRVSIVYVIALWQITKAFGLSLTVI